MPSERDEYGEGKMREKKARNYCFKPFGYSQFEGGMIYSQCHYL